MRLHVTKKNWSKLLQQDHKFSFVQPGYQRRRKILVGIIACYIPEVFVTCMLHALIRPSHLSFMISQYFLHQTITHHTGQLEIRQFQTLLFLGANERKAKCAFVTFSYWNSTSSTINLPKGRRKDRGNLPQEICPRFHGSGRNVSWDIAD